MTIVAGHFPNGLTRRPADHQGRGNGSQEYRQVVPQQNVLTHNVPEESWRPRWPLLQDIDEILLLRQEKRPLFEQSPVQGTRPPHRNRWQHVAPAWSGRRRRAKHLPE